MHNWCTFSRSYLTLRTFWSLLGIKELTFVYLTKEVFLNYVCLRQMMLASPMMTATPNDVCLTANWANIASLRNTVEQHHFERSEKHHIATGDASFEDIQGIRLDFV